MDYQKRSGSAPFAADGCHRLLLAAKPDERVLVIKTVPAIPTTGRCNFLPSVPRRRKPEALEKVVQT